MFLVVVLALGVIAVAAAATVRAEGGGPAIGAFTLQLALFVPAASVAAAVASVLLLHRVARLSVGIAAAVRMTLRHGVHVVAAGLLVSIVALAAILLLGPLASLVVIPLLVGPPVLVQVIVWEGLPFQEALRRTRILVRDHWSRVFLYLFTIALAVGVAQMVVTGVLGSLLVEFVRSRTTASVLVVSVANSVVAALALAYMAAASVVAYLDLRFRAEGISAERLRAEASARSAGAVDASGGGSTPG